MFGNKLRAHRTIKAVWSAFFLAALVVFAPKIGYAQAPDVTVPPKPGAPRPISVPTPIGNTLENGLRIIVIERPGTGLVSAQVLIRAGSEADSEAGMHPGVAAMTASLLTKGTRSRNATQVAEALEALGGSLSANAGWDATRINLNVLAAQFEPAMNIVADVVRYPTFRTPEIARLRVQTLDDLTVSLREPGTLARLTAARVLYGDNPYGHPIQGTPESVRRIQQSDILRFHKENYVPGNTIIVIGGDIKAQTAFNLVKRLFGDWRGVAFLDYRTPQAPPAKQGRVVVIDKPDAGQAAVVVTHQGIRRTDNDYFRGIVANAVLGTGFSSRLNEEIRIKRGLSYGASSILEARRSVGPFIARTQTKNESAAEVADLMRGELTKLANAPLAMSELEPRQSVLVGDFTRQLERSSGLVNSVGELALYGISPLAINSYMKNVLGVTGDSARDFATRYLNPRSADVIIVGNAQKFLPDLKKRFATSFVEIIPVAQLDLNSANLHHVALNTKIGEKVSRSFPSTAPPVSPRRTRRGYRSRFRRSYTSRTIVPQTYLRPYSRTYYGRRAVPAPRVYGKGTARRVPVRRSRVRRASSPRPAVTALQ